ncbi:protein of unknown function [Acidithiobacillus ferrivorans]|uniref:Uncharacterized protein n=1 Tax=Acidithiobacillus ferrivorans TaxID=160808 RepID=A0ABY1MKN6_9PROT|nr:protein of unknown function [Acidithiobacillus ferrivorans]
MHSVHLAGSITKVPFFSEMAIFGHSGSQAEQLVHWELTILKAMMFLLLTKTGEDISPDNLTQLHTPPAGSPRLRAGHEQWPHYGCYRDNPDSRQ